MQSKAERKANQFFVITFQNTIYFLAYVRRKTHSDQSAYQYIRYKKHFPARSWNDITFHDASAVAVKGRVAGKWLPELNGSTINFHYYTPTNSTTSRLCLSELAPGRWYIYLTLTITQKAWSSWEMVKHKMLDFSDDMQFTIVKN